MCIHDIYDEEEFKKLFPEIYKQCQKFLKDKKVYFGECFQLEEKGNINVYYNFEEDENKTAIFEFDKTNILLEYNLSID